MKSSPPRSKSNTLLPLMALIAGCSAACNAAAPPKAEDESMTSVGTQTSHQNTNTSSGEVTQSPMAPSVAPSSPSSTTNHSNLTDTAVPSATVSNPLPVTSEAAEAGSSELNPVAPSRSGGLGPFVCPEPPYAAVPVLEGALPERVPGFPPADDFASDSDTVILEGPAWSSGVLYLSQINAGTPTFGRPGGFPRDTADGGSTIPAEDAGPEQPPRPPPSRLLALDAAGNVAVVLEDAGTNGLALDATGRLLAGNHKTGSVGVVPIGGGAPANIASTYEGVRFNSPNDVTVGRDGTVYFSDPDYQAPSPAPQTQTRAYRIPPGTNSAIPIGEDRRQPNGITLSPSGETLYISASDGLRAHIVMADGSVGAGEPFADGVVRTSDGMAVDCAGNLYTTSGQSVIVVDAMGIEVSRISVPDVQSVTNVAFGGPESKTIYVTTLGSGSRVGLFRVPGEVPGMPF